MSIDTFARILFWTVSLIVCAVMTAFGYFLPWIAPSVALFFVGVMALISQYDKKDVLQGIAMFFLCPIAGTLFIKPSPSLGDYEWLLGLWILNFILGYVASYALQQRRNEKDKLQSNIAAAQH